MPLTNALLQITKDEEKTEYFRALGMFMQTFAIAEAAMQILLWKVSGMPDMKTATALFSGIKLDQSISLVRRVRETKNLPESKLLTHLFQQLSVINSARNDIVHFGATFTEGAETLVSNFRSAHIPERVRGFHISPSLLRDMNTDTITIVEKILRVVESYNRPPSPDPDELDTWLYKHALLTNNRRKSPDKTPKLKRQRKPSQG